MEGRLMRKKLEVFVDETNAIVGITIKMYDDDTDIDIVVKPENITVYRKGNNQYDMYLWKEDRKQKIKQKELEELAKR